MIFAGQGRHAQAGQFTDGRHGPLWISGGIPDHQLQWPPGDPARDIDLTGSKFEPSQQVPPGLGPAGPGQRTDHPDLDG